MVLLLRGGRVVDPGTGLDGVADVLVRGSEVAAVGADLPVPDGAAVVDVTGLVVGPGFVDLHSHVHSVAGQRLQGMDGVTTALDLESGLHPVERAYADAAAQGRPLNYGFSASWGAARAKAQLGFEENADPWAGMKLLDDPRWQRSSTPAELVAWLRDLEHELSTGALGVGVPLGYAPETDPAEFLTLAALAARADAPIFTHVRELVETDPSTRYDGSAELVRAAVETGAAMHHCHVNSTSLRHIDRVLDLLATTQAAGSRVTVECYPYGAGSTGIGAYFLAPERLAGLGVGPTSITMVESGERVADLGRLRQLRELDPAAGCIIAFLDEDDPADAALLRRSMVFPDSMVASDALPIQWPDGSWDTYEWPLPPGGRTHPRTAGTYAKTLRQMVRESGTWTWLEAFRRCSWLPARTLDPVAPAAARKGHLGVGADADIVVLDPERITDTATYQDSTRPSAGVHHLLVAGTFVVRDQRMLDALPGRPLRG
ncbi:amidohydrolase family protein [Actinosynnema sp. NPDC047251]|uniref:D-glutamate deacylase n=1 Tax=Saccharothrix espanaensis (strain ATCC 51144 / DSM 44229 / JCM 9112 / NBRC 15066 / NRRL 15764) TaxID=1179773 RepID=K0K117_SACES|nr:amidohydrolase family protein [Saccharothrix espanaensis]CCH31242.1 D-glutamate deacylase [Saccharothrix espanaensis DSM 44229]